jgi:hypothetical protein
MARKLKLRLSRTEKNIKSSRSVKQNNTSIYEIVGGPCVSGTERRRRELQYI